MATFAELYRESNGKPFRAKDVTGCVAVCDGLDSHSWEDGRPISSSMLFEHVKWTLIPPEPTVEDVLREAGYEPHALVNGEMRVRELCRNAGLCFYIHKSKFPTTADQARELVAFLDKYREDK